MFVSEKISAIPWIDNKEGPPIGRTEWLWYKTGKAISQSPPGTFCYHMLKESKVLLSVWLKS